MSSGSASSTANNQNVFDEIAVKIGGKENAKMFGYEMMYAAASKANAKNFDLMRILLERYHSCKAGYRFNLKYPLLN